MGSRFRRSVRVGGARVNFGKRGISSVTFGRRGFGVNVSRRGVRPRVGIPGSGLSYHPGRGCCLVPASLLLSAGLALTVLLIA